MKPKHRSAVARQLEARQFHRRIVRSKKIYTRKGRGR
jgi:hypothetical protein